MSENIKKCWYKEMAVYQIWPRSFCDGNGDGVGDLIGILSKLDYIKSLGVDAIWFSPLYESPGKDHGYDISDYRKIASYFGTNEDFKAVLDGAHERGLKVIYIDPEGFFTKNGFESYPIEGPKNQDLVYKIISKDFPVF